MPKKNEALSRRERQIMDALYRLGKASAAEVRDAIDEPPTYTAVRTHLGILQEKGHIRYESDGTRYIYEPVVPRDQMAKSAIDNVLQTFFGGSVERVVATLVDRDEAHVTDEQLARLAEIIERARQEGR
ncbi:BlaI/MecI/CopY family transcriptional regulator [Fimbriimonas ginsengisoli]|uniref:Transcriptional repressor, CopY family n=1 Tax=Fimbriimonas ginsengisoli Gsoil 348 TaxID=661478 RepID=A0A068NLF4_FIMGI|nr:BlaI/MecI/CopY family transcriptional regulator [Fimbriimonas ginsengisoli]AIE84316.1 transcriptional repressor, CopY family [Fimbriimonas ginsengisoli Gsoil 348]